MEIFRINVTKPKSRGLLPRPGFRMKSKKDYRRNQKHKNQDESY